MKSLKFFTTNAKQKTAVALAIAAGVSTVALGTPRAEAAPAHDTLCSYSAFRVPEFSIKCGDEEAAIKFLADARIRLHEDDADYNRVSGSLTVLRHLKDKPAGTYQYGETKKIGALPATAVPDFQTALGCGDSGVNGLPTRCGPFMKKSTEGDSSDYDRSNEAGNESVEGAPGPGDGAFDDGRWD